MKSIYKIHTGQVDGIDVFKVYDFNPCTIENVNSNYVKEAVAMCQYITDAEALKGNTNDRVPYTMSLIQMKKVYDFLQKNDCILDIERMISDFSIALADLMAILEGGEPQYEKWLDQLMLAINKNNECY